MMTRHENVSLLALCEGNPPVTDGFLWPRARNDRLWYFSFEGVVEQIVRRWWFETKWSSCYVTIFFNPYAKVFPLHDIFLFFSRESTVDFRGTECIFWNEQSCIWRSVRVCPGILTRQHGLTHGLTLLNKIWNNTQTCGRLQSGK